MNFKTREDLGHWLALNRRRRRLSQADLAKALGYSTAQYVSNWERGEVLPSIDSLPVLRDLLRVPMRTLVEGMCSIQVEEVKDKYQQILGEMYKKRKARLPKPI